ncbi:MAG TPA: VWA domain-containing protein [Candidatus Limnocylindrales bacterium]|nr:VWA domain-containing protein [Candidatus Limnocylindrales bacterium]
MAKTESPLSTALRRTWNVILILALLLAALAAPTPAQERSATTIRTTTRLVQLNVVVLDNHGRPVSGLAQDDFDVFDNGHLQKLSHFAVSASPTPGSRPEASPLILTNRPPHHDETSPGVTVILVDELLLQNIYASESAKASIRSARLAVLSFLSTLQPGEQVALYALRFEGIVVIHDLTDDSAALIAAAKTLGTGLHKGAIPIGDTAQAAAFRSMRSWMESGSHLSRRNEARDDLTRILAGDAFLAIAHHLRGTPARKNLVWISPNFPSLVYGLDPGTMLNERDTILPNSWGPTQPVFANPEGYFERMRNFARMLSNANVALYPMDAKGLPGGGYGGDQRYSPVSVPYADTQGAVPWLNTAPASVSPPPGSVSGLFGERQAMELLASETGGRVFYDTNGLDSHIHEVVDDSRVAYLLGYYPGDAAWDSKYHHVEVKLKRPGLSAHCRKGYFAKDEPLTPFQDAVLRDAAKSMLEWAAIGVTLNVPSNPLGWFDQDVVLKLDTENLHFENTEGRFRANLDVLFALLAKDGRVLDSIKDRLELALYPQTFSDASSRGWLYPKTLYVSPEAEKLRVVVRDLGNGAVGSVSIPVRK